MIGHSSLNGERRMTSDNVTLTRENGYALIVLNRPEVLNALSLALMTDLADALEESDAPEAIRRASIRPERVR